jgi:hypothetical protein
MKWYRSNKKNYSHLSPIWDAYYVGTRAGRVPWQRYTIFAEVVSETLRLLSPSVPNTTVEIKVFTDLGAKDLNGSTAYLRTPFCKYATTSSDFKENQPKTNVEVRVKRRFLHLVQQPDYIGR